MNEAPAKLDGMGTLKRCPWADGDPLMAEYHDQEWGRPVHDDRVLFEFLTLEGAQAGLSWLTVLRKRERYRELFHGFDPQRVVRMTPRALERVLSDPGIIRHRGKIESVVSNARAVIEIQRTEGSFDAFVWSFVGGKPIVRRPRTPADVPSSTPESDALAAALKKRGFRFVGTTICYAFMQATGMVNDHLVSCHLATHTQGVR